MSLSTCDIVETVQDVWSTVLGMPAGVLPDANEMPGDVAAWVEISGEWTGTVCLRLTAGHARKCTAVMFCDDADAVSDEDVHDVMGELANIIGGNLKALLPESCNLSLPVVKHGDSDPAPEFDGDPSKVVFSTEEAGFSLTVYGNVSETRSEDDLVNPFMNEGVLSL